MGATHEIGNGAYTVFRQIAADALALPVEAVMFDLCDSTFPDSPVRRLRSLPLTPDRVMEALR